MNAKYGDIIEHNNTGQIFLVMKNGELIRIAGSSGVYRWEERSKNDTHFTLSGIARYTVLFNFIDILRKGLGE